MFKEIWGEAAVEKMDKGEVVMFGTRTYIPCSLRGEFMKFLHMSADTMYKTFCSIWVWEGIKNNLKQLVDNCPECLDWARSKPQQAPMVATEGSPSWGPWIGLGWTCVNGRARTTL